MKEQLGKMVFWKNFGGDMRPDEAEFRQKISALVAEYYERFKKNRSEFMPGQTPIHYAGRTFDSAEMVSLMEATLDFWLTSGRFVDRFEAEFSRYLGLEHCLLVNSGSSANLVALSSLTSPVLKDRRLRRGDEVITLAAGFPTTIAPIIQAGAVPVFCDVDVERGTYNVDLEELSAAIGPRTKAVFMAHTLGNPFEVEAISQICKKNGIWLIEDNCDALGSRHRDRLTGTFGDLATSSFFPPHHITMGEGGAVYTNNSQLRRVIESFRDWGRDCWCPSGHDNTCKKRFKWKFEGLPDGYDHKYVYSHFGYNLKATEMQAAIGCIQVQRIDEFGSKRRRNWQFLRQALKDLEDVFVLPNPTPNSDPSWFGFALTIREGVEFSRSELTQFLESKRIQTRNLFAGNMIRQPAFLDYIREGHPYRTLGALRGSDTIMNRTFWIGVYPGLTPEMLDYIVSQIRFFVANFRSESGLANSPF